MLSIIRGGRPPLTPDELIEGVRDDRQKTALRLADMALATFDPEHAGEHYEQLLRGTGPFSDPSVEMESYLLFRMGQSLHYQGKLNEAQLYLKRLYEPRYGRYEWAGDGIARLGTWIYNATDDTEEAMKHWKHVFTRHPDHPEAEASLFFYGIFGFENKKDYVAAQHAFELYLERYPDSRWSERVRDNLLPRIKKKR